MHGGDDARDGGDDATGREPLAAAPADWKAKLDAGRVDTLFRVGNRVLLRTEKLLDAADMGRRRPRRDGPLTVLARPSPNAYTSRCRVACAAALPTASNP